MPLAAITFDVWDTLLWETPGSLREHRLAYWAEQGITGVEAAHDEAHQSYVAHWKRGEQFRIEEAAALIAERHGLHGRRDELLEGFREGGRRAEVVAAPGARDCLAALRSRGLVLGVVCDIGLTPSDVVRELLDREGLLEFFAATTFSDEVGHFKPSQAAFEHALGALGVDAAAAGHIGDRRRTDVAGALGMGMLAIRFVGPRDHETETTPEGDLVVERLADLPGALP